MSFTRFSDDPNRIRKQLEQTTFVGRYMLDVPGQGIDLTFFEDPQIRMQKWGANLRDNTVNLESDLFGMTRKLNRDIIDINDYKTYEVKTNEKQWGTSKPFVEESRASHPAWMYKSLEQDRWENPFLNPLDKVEKKFVDNLQTRILEKDYYLGEKINSKFIKET
jgi:hypothetical protein